MPITGIWEATTLVQAPQRFRSGSGEHQPQQQQEQPHRTSQTVGLPPVRPRKQPVGLGGKNTVGFSGSPSNQTAQASPRPTSDSRKHDSIDHKQTDAYKSRKGSSACSSSWPLVVAPTTRKAPKSLSIMELVNQVAQQEEHEEAELARRRAALLIAGKGTTKLHPVPSRSNSSSQCNSPRIPSSPVSVRASRPLNPLQATNIRALPTVARAPLPRAASDAAAQAAQSTVGLNQPERDVPSRAPDVSKHPQQQQQQQQQQLSLSRALSLSSDSTSDEIAATPPSMSSSASSSSLCSTASLISNASTISSSGRPKSILLNRTSTGSSCSSGSSPRFSKRVTWKDGQADEESVGQGLVAVVVLEDDPELRQLRKNTWPERPGARRDALEAQAAAAAAATAEATAAAAAANPQPQQPEQQKQTGLVGKLLQEPTRLLDWRDKLKQLQADRRQQHLAQVQAAWEMQERKMARQDTSSSQQQQQQQQNELQQEADASAALDITSSKTGSAAALCSTVTINVVAVAAGVEAVM